MHSPDHSKLLNMNELLSDDITCYIQEWFQLSMLSSAAIHHHDHFSSIHHPKMQPASRVDPCVPGLEQCNCLLQSPLYLLQPITTTTTKLKHTLNLIGTCIGS